MAAAGPSLLARTLNAGLTGQANVIGPLARMALEAAQRQLADKLIMALQLLRNLLD
jgi:hypothetical protein